MERAVPDNQCHSIIAVVYGTRGVLLPFDTARDFTTMYQSLSGPSSSMDSSLLLHPKPSPNTVLDGPALNQMLQQVHQRCALDVSFLGVFG